MAFIGILLISIAGYRCSSISRYFELEEGLVLENLRTELQKLYRQHFSKAISLSGKLAPIYPKVKKEYREESYISVVEYHKYRSAITRFRISAHNLPLEKGRWEGINKTERKCKKCINNDVGDEKHYILHCNAPDVVKLRAMFSKDNKLVRIPSECASSFIGSILARSKGTPQSTGKFLNGIIEFLKDK